MMSDEDVRTKAKHFIPYYYYYTEEKRDYWVYGYVCRVHSEQFNNFFYLYGSILEYGFTFQM